MIVRIKITDLIKIMFTCSHWYFLLKSLIIVGKKSIKYLLRYSLIILELVIIPRLHDLDSTIKLNTIIVYLFSWF